MTVRNATTEKPMSAHSPQAPDAVLDVQKLTTAIRTQAGTIRPVDHVSFSVRQGEILGLVGESGSGKTMTVLSIMRLLPDVADITGGAVFFKGQNLLDLSTGQMRDVRGKNISMVFQEPMTALDPAFTVGYQIIETITAHSDVGRAEARSEAIDILQLVGIPHAAERMKEYPHQFSGGMRQRVVLAIALAMRPALLLADEPTTALDVTIQAQILDLIARLKDELDMSVVFITHDLAVVHELVDRVAVMYAGEIVEIGPVDQMFEDPRHPYTQGLLRSMPNLAGRGGKMHVISGRVPNLSALPSGCRFAPRCPNRIERCDIHPDLEKTDKNGHELRCFNPTPFER